MQSPAREPSMEDILASIKRVIAEEKDMRSTAPREREPEEALLAEEGEDEVLELDQPLTPVDLGAVDLGPPLVDQEVAQTSRQSLETLTTIAATAPALPPVNPLEE